MRNLVAVAVLSLGSLVACSDTDPVVEDAPGFVGQRTYAFGPYDVAPGQEITSDCVQITLGNEDYAYVNAVELTTGPGFHHSNWFYVPEFAFPGEDGTYKCRDRNFDQAVAAIQGGVLFAQSTQAAHEIQQFPAGMVIKIPPKSKLVTQIHLLNPSDNPLSLTPDIKLTYIAAEDVTTPLAAISFQNAALALPPNMASRFSVECDLSEKHETLLGRPIDFKLHYALAHYHDLGTGMTIEALRPDNTSAVVYTTDGKVGDALGGMIAPGFDMTGFTKLRMTCDFYNSRTTTVGWGVGTEEMCVFLAFTDSTYNFGGGVLEETAPQNPMMVGNTMTYSNPCVLFANDASR